MISRLLELLTRQFPAPGEFHAGPRGPYPLHDDRRRNPAN